MRVRTPEKSSILLLGRNSVVLGAVLIIIVSFGLGYLVGYKGAPAPQTEQEIKSSPEPKAAIPPEEKKVLEPVNNQDSLITPIKPSELPSEIKAKKQQEQALEKSEQKAPENKAEKEQLAEKKADAEDKESRPAPKAALHKQTRKAVKPSEKAGSPRGTAAAKKLYAVQFGAFPSREGAEQLQQTLKAKGIKTYLVNRSEKDPYFRVRTGGYKSRKEAERHAIALQKTTGVQNFVAVQ